MRLGDDLEVLEVLAGGMGEVFICEYVREDESGERRQPVALKTFQRRFFFENPVRVAFVREASVWLRLTGLPHILPALAVEQIDGRPFVLMPAVPAGPRGARTVADLLRHDALAPRDAVLFALQIALAMRMAADRVPGLVHGDIKPANILLLGGKAYLSDFGLASAAALGRADTRLIATPAYLAPELSRNEAAPTVASDVFAFGASLAEMLAKADRSDALVATAMQLARDCMAADRESRPADFGPVQQRLHDLVFEHDPFAATVLMTDAVQYRDMFSGPEATSLRARRINSLIDLGETAQALEELDGIPRDRYTPRLWLLRAMTLSLLNRPKEAIEALRPAMEGNLTPEERVLARSEYALCLKRLGRLDEARRIYEDLMLDVDAEHLPIVIVNLATVLLQQRQFEEVVRLLEPFVRKHPDLAAAWANLGRGYLGVGRYEDAEKAFGRALHRDPNAGQVRVWLAELYMDHLNRIPEAYAVLDVAFDAGHESREWLMRLLACAILLRREDTLAGLKDALDRNFAPDVADSIAGDAIAIVKRISGLDDQPPAEAQPDPEAQPQLDEKPLIEPVMRTGAIRHIQFRFYDAGDFTIDTYGDPYDDEFLESFVREWRRVSRDPRLSIQGGLRGSPFVFTRCPECGVFVMTNRDVGYKIDCQVCKTRSHVSPLDEPRLAKLTAEVARIVGVTDGAEVAGSVYALFVQTAEGDQQARAEEICGEFGMSRRPKDEYLALMMLKEAMERGATDFLRAWSVWTMPAEPVRWAQEATPPTVARIVERLQGELPGIKTISMTLTPEQVDALSETVSAVNEREEREIREKLRRHDASAEEMRRLAELLDARGAYGEAEQIIRAALALDDTSAEGWGILGRILVRTDRFRAAQVPLERSIALDPRQALNVGLLAVCYDRTGDPRAAETDLRARALMANREPPFGGAG